MQRRSFLAGLLATAAGLLVPGRLLEDDPKRVYSFVRRPPVTPAELARILAASVNSGGCIRLYDGAKPERLDTDISDQVMLAELEFTGSGFSGDAEATGTASWVRYQHPNGTVVDLPIVLYGEKGNGGALSMNTRCVVSTANISCSALTITPSDV
jgi:hypothetical protein